MKNRHRRKLRWFAVLVAIVAIAVYVRPAWTGKIYKGTELAEKALGGPCVPGDYVAPWDGKGFYFGGELMWKNYDCFEIRTFSPRSLPLAGVLGFASLIVLIFGLRGKSRRG